MGWLFAWIQSRSEAGCAVHRAACTCSLALREQRAATEGQRDALKLQGFMLHQCLQGAEASNEQIRCECVWDFKTHWLPFIGLLWT